MGQHHCHLLVSVHEAGHDSRWIIHLTYLTLKYTCETKPIIAGCRGQGHIKFTANYADLSMKWVVLDELEGIALLVTVPLYASSMWPLAKFTHMPTLHLS